MGGKLLASVRNLLSAFSASDARKMRSLGNRLIGDAAFENSKALAEVALVAYSLHKLATKEHVSGHDKWPLLKRRVLASLKNAVRQLEKGDEQGFEKTMKGIVKDISSMDAKIGNFAQNIFEKARVKYASNAYSFGLSLSQAAELTGANKKHLLEYVGATRILDREKPIMGIGERLKKLKGAV